MIDVVTMRELWKENIDGYIPVLLEVYNPDIVWSADEKEAYNQEDSYIRLIADNSRVIYKGKTYLPCAFTFTAPEIDGRRVGNASITISALDTRVRKILRIIQLPSQVTVVSVFAKTEKSEGQYVYRFAEISTTPFTMNSAGSNPTTATFNLVFDKDMAQQVPYDVATPDRVPGTKG